MAIQVVLTRNDKQAHALQFVTIRAWAPQSADSNEDRVVEGSPEYPFHDINGYCRGIKLLICSCFI